MFEFLKKLFAPKKRKEIRKSLHEASSSVPNKEPAEVEANETVAVTEEVKVTVEETKPELVKHTKTELNKLTKPKLLELAKSIDLDLDTKMKKADIIATILANQ